MVIGPILGMFPSGADVCGAEDAFSDYLRKDREAFNLFQRGGSESTQSNANARAAERSPVTSDSGAGEAVTAVPSAEAQRLDLTKGVSILIPASALSQPTVFSVRVVTHEAVLLGDGDSRPLGGVELDVQPASAVAWPLTVTFPYAATRMNPRYSAEEQLMVEQQTTTNGIWRPVPFAVSPLSTDALQTVQATVRTCGMLRCVSVAYERRPKAKKAGGDVYATPRGGLSTVAIGGIVFGTGIAANQMYEWVWLDVHTSAHFRVLYSASAVTDSATVGATNWPAAAGTTSTVPAFVQSLTDFGEVAWSAYTNAGFAMPASPVTVKLDAWYFRNHSAPGLYDWRWGRIHIRTDKFAVKDKFRSLKHRIGHELFHACQNAVLGLFLESTMQKFLAYLEATAEYASCRLAWTLDSEMGHGNLSLNPKLLQYPFMATGVHPGEGSEVEYDKGYWIEYFCKSGVTITGLCAAVSARAADYDPFRSGLDDCLRALPLPSSAGDCYRRLAAYYLFADAVPSRFGASCTESGNAIDLPSAPNTFAPVNWSTALATGLTAKVFMMVAPGNMDGQARLQVQLTALSGGAVVDVFKFPDSQRVPGTPDVSAPWHVGSMNKVGDVCPLTADACARIYLVAINTNTAAAQVGVQVSLANVLIDRLDPVMAATGTTMRVFGTGFGDDPKAGKVCFAGAEVPGTGVVSWQDKGIALLVPLQAISGNVTVNVNGSISNPKWLNVADPLKVEFKKKYEEDYLTEIVIDASGGKAPYGCSWTLEKGGADGTTSGTGFVVQTKIYAPSHTHVFDPDGPPFEEGPPALLTYTLVDALCQTNSDAVNMGETPWPFE